MNYKSLLLAFTAVLLLHATSLFAQAVESGVAMASEMRQSGKIYVVVAVLVIIFLGIIAYLISLDRKITKLEQKNKIHLK